MSRSSNSSTNASSPTWTECPSAWGQPVVVTVSHGAAATHMPNKQTGVRATFEKTVSCLNPLRSKARSAWASFYPTFLFFATLAFRWSRYPIETIRTRSTKTTRHSQCYPEDLDLDTKVHAATGT